MDTTSRDDALIERRTEELLNAPAGQAILTLIDGYGLTPDQVAEPLVTAHLVIDAIDLISPWDPTTPARMELLADLVPGLTSLARRLVSSPALASWWAPLNLSGPQLWTAHRGMSALEPVDRVTAGEPTWFERYAHKPEPSTMTSTLIGDDWSMLAYATLRGASDLDAPEGAASLDACRLTLRDGTRVFEVDGPDDWVRLCRTYPDDRPPGLNRPDELPECVPHWRDVARDWDGVHVSVGGLLTATDRWVEHDRGRSRLWAWEAECTYWLRDVFRTREPSPPIPIDGDRFDPPREFDEVDASVTLSAGWLLSDPNVLILGDGMAARALREGRTQGIAWGPWPDADAITAGLATSPSLVARWVSERLSRRR